MNQLAKHPSIYRYLRLAISGSLFLLLTACASHIVVNVNAINDPSRNTSGQRYYMQNANDDNTSPELYFQEFRAYFDYLLTKQGFIKTEDRNSADIEIRFTYGISDGRTGIQHYSWPIYETFGGERVTITERVTTSGGSTQTIKRTVYIPSYVRQVGSSHETLSYTVYNRYLNLAAFPIKPGDNQSTETVPLWNVNTYSVGESNDLRAIMPYLAAASGPFLGKNSGQQQSVELNNQSPQIIELKQLISGQK